jgi:hypothetical protein
MEDGLSTKSSAELKQAITDIGSAKDVVDLLAVLLGICRRHPKPVLDASGDPQKRQQLRAQRESLQKEAATTFTSRGLSEGTKQFAIDKLEQGSDLAVTARALALGIDDAVRSRDPTAYGQLCRKWPVRELKEGDPYPTPKVDISSMYGGSHGLSSRPGTNARTAFDRVDGLALWGNHPLDVIYDTVAGVCLDNALGQTVDILAVSPNGKIDDFRFKEISAVSFFGARLKKPRLQNDILRAVLRKAIDLDVDIVVTPELSSTTRTVELIKQSTAHGRPRIVIAGGTHVTIDGKRLNRLSTIYTGPKPRVVHHDKIGEYKFYELDEAIDRPRKLRIHAGINWSMIPLICADFLEDAVVDAVANLRPRLVMVPSMSSKTVGFVMRMGQVISESQALVVVVNGPHDWGGEKAPVLVTGLPLEDLNETFTALSPTPSDKPPYRILFRSSGRGAKLI